MKILLLLILLIRIGGRAMRSTDDISRYIEKQVGDDLNLQCMGNYDTWARWASFGWGDPWPNKTVFGDNWWLFPNVTNSELVGYDLSAFMQRVEVKSENTSSTLKIRDLKETDTGMYVCGNFLTKFVEQVYLFVKDRKIFLKRRHDVVNLTLNDALRDADIPCRASSSITGSKMKLFVDDEEWVSFCRYRFAEYFNVLVAIGPKGACCAKGNVNCSSPLPLSKFYDAKRGFDFFVGEKITTNQDNFLRAQFDNKHFRCQFGNISSDRFLVQTPATQVYYGGPPHKVNCTVLDGKTFIFDTDINYLRLACPKCDLFNDKLFIDRALDRLQNRDILDNVSILWKISNEYDDVFCDWIRQAGDLTDPTVFLPFTFTVPSKRAPNQETLLAPWMLGLFVLVVSTVIALIYWKLSNDWKKKDNRLLLEDSKMSSEEAGVVEPSEIQVTGAYKPGRWIGRGRYGDVYLVEDHQPEAVIKYVNARTPEQLNVFRRELESLGLLKHPNIVRLLQTELVEELNRLGLIMEFCSRGDLGKVIFDANIIYTMCTVLVWARQLFDALDYMYQEHKIVHRDLKPENILVTDEYFLKIGDLGAAKYIDHTFSGSFVGTHRYMSPLQIDESQEISDPSKQSIQHSHKNDVYSLGLVLWEIVERRVVLAGYNERDGYFNRDLFSHDINSKKLKEALLCRCQANVQELIENCTRFARNERPTAYVVLEDLQAILSSDLFISQLTFEPREEEEQRKLLRPIGFNGTEERVFILDHFGINLDPSVDLFAPVMMEIC